MRAWDFGLLMGSKTSGLRDDELGYRSKFIFSIRRVHTLPPATVFGVVRGSTTVCFLYVAESFQSEVIRSRCHRVSGALRVRASVGMVCSMLEAGAALFSNEVLLDCTRVLHVAVQLLHAWHRER